MYVISATHADSPSAQGRGTRREAEASRAQSPLPGRMTAPLGAKTGPSPSGTSHSPTGSAHNGERGPRGSCQPQGHAAPLLWLLVGRDSLGVRHPHPCTDLGVEAGGF